MLDVRTVVYRVSCIHVSPLRLMRYISLLSVGLPLATYYLSRVIHGIFSLSLGSFCSTLMFHHDYCHYCYYCCCYDECCMCMFFDFFSFLFWIVFFLHVCSQAIVLSCLKYTVATIQNAPTQI